jgi:hypothetical protein
MFRKKTNNAQSPSIQQTLTQLLTLPDPAIESVYHEDATNFFIDIFLYDFLANRPHCLDARDIHSSLKDFEKMLQNIHNDSEFIQLCHQKNKKNIFPLTQDSINTILSYFKKLSDPLFIEPFLQLLKGFDTDPDHPISADELLPNLIAELPHDIPHEQLAAILNILAAIAARIKNIPENTSYVFTKFQIAMADIINQKQKKLFEDSRQICEKYIDQLVTSLNKLFHAYLKSEDIKLIQKILAVTNKESRYAFFFELAEVYKEGICLKKEYNDDDLNSTEKNTVEIANKIINCHSTGMKAKLEKLFFCIKLKAIYDNPLTEKCAADQHNQNPNILYQATNQKAKECLSQHEKVFKMNEDGPVTYSLNRMANLFTCCSWQDKLSKTSGHQFVRDLQTLFGNIKYRNQSPVAQKNNVVLRS